MNEWKQAWQLSKIELHKYPVSMVSSCLIFALMAFFLGASFPAYMDERTFGLYDLAFLLLFALFPYWLKPKDTRFQMVSTDFYVSPYFIKLMQLPIPESIIIKHRFVTYLAQTVPFQVLFLLLFYLFSGMNGYVIPPLTFIVFSIIWIAFGVYAGHAFPANDAGERQRIAKTVILMVIAFLAGMLFYILFTTFSPRGVVMWSVLLASEWPVLSVVISIFLAAIGMRFWMHRMKKRMNRMDYLC